MNKFLAAIETLTVLILGNKNKEKSLLELKRESVKPKRKYTRRRTKKP